MYECPIDDCEITCTTPYTLIDHVSDIHDKKITVDEVKLYISKEKNNKKKQIAKVQKKANKVARTSCVCKLCAKTFFKFSNLKRHMKNVHEGNCVPEGG